MRTAVRVLAATLGAVAGAVLGLVASILLWLVLADGGGPEVPLGSLFQLVRLAVPTGLIAGGVIGWNLGRERRA